MARVKGKNGGSRRAPKSERLKTGLDAAVQIPRIAPPTGIHPCGFPALEIAFLPGFELPYMPSEGILRCVDLR
jgi:hypothetical protein